MNLDSIKNINWEAPKAAVAKWQMDIQAANPEDNSISIFDTIGDDGMGGGVSMRRISAALRSMKDDDVVVNINSPGGSMFEGVAIYNALKEHKGKVKIKVLGMAASAASIIAMAGDEVEIAKSAFFMIHNSWVVALGNRHDLIDTAKTLEPFDAAMAGIYSERTGIDVKEITKMMDAESWINGEQAVEMGFATALLASDEVEKTDKTRNALKRIDVALAKDGVSRTERRAMLKSLSGTPCAAEDVTPRADDEAALLKELLTIIKK